MKILSLFDGISCARVALERAGIEVEKYYASEIDKYAIKIAQKNYPDTVQLGDINDLVCAEGLKKYLPEIDLVIGGSPCQDLSIAKKNRQGLAGKRSGLFYQFVNIIKCVKPKWFILENVASMPKEAKEIITKELGVEPIMINAALVSAQNRKRLFWTNIPNVKQPEDKGILLRDILEDGVNESYSVYNKKLSIGKATTLGSNSQCFTAKTGQGIPIRVGQIGKGGQGNRIYSIQGKSVNLSANGGGRGAKTGLYKITNNGYETNDSVPEIGQAIRKYHKNGKIPPLNNWSPTFEDDNSFVRKLTPIECERLQCLPDNYTEGISNTQRYKCLGNAFNVDVVAHILSFLINNFKGYEKI